MNKLLALFGSLPLVCILALACGSSDTQGCAGGTAACQQKDKCVTAACGSLDDKCSDDCGDYLKCTGACTCGCTQCLTSCQPKLTAACGKCVQAVESCGQQNCSAESQACTQSQTAAGSCGSAGSSQ